MVSGVTDSVTDTVTDKKKAAPGAPTPEAAKELHWTGDPK